VLPATRRRVFPASVLVTAALSVGLMATSVPAQAATATSTATTSTTAASSTVATTSAVTSALAPTAAQAAAVAMAHKIAANRAVQRLAAAHTMRLRASAVHIARTKVGSRYVAGHSGPTKFDCSGLALYVVKKATGRSLPHYSKAQYRATKRVAKSQLRPGDLVFFFRHGAHHVGIYIGNGRMISATNPRHGVKIDSVFSGWYGSRYSGAGRLV
jgi:peptidoglycan DL-endopeptidase CwlO